MGVGFNEKASQEVKLRPIEEVAKKAGISAKNLKMIGKNIAKVSLGIFDGPLKKRKEGKLVLVTSITPTHFGEGKSVISIGLSAALNKLGSKAIACLPQPSHGPIFGLKGCGTGGGHAQVLPNNEINLGLAGDMYSVQNAQNLCAAALDSSFYWGNPLNLNKDTITWRRALDVGDRSLRNITIGGGGKMHGVSRKTGFSITSAGECMAILSIAKDLKDLRERLGKIVVGYSTESRPITADNLKVAGAMTAIMKDSLEPAIVQSTDHSLCFMHGGAFANTSHGTGSYVSEKMALKLADFAIVESGFGADLGAEKYFDVKCRQTGKKPDVVIINCSVRALKVHSGDFTAKGSKLPESIKREDLSAVDRGCSNLEKQVENLKMFGVPIVVAINRFERDTVKELDVIKRRAEALEVDAVAVCDAYREGASGGKELAKAVLAASKVKSKFRYLYPVDMDLKNKIERISKSMYGASEIRYSDDALKHMGLIEKAKLDKVPICMAKTHLSLANNAKKKGRPRGFVLNVESVEATAGAGYITVYCDGTNSMPGTPKTPRYASIDVDVKTGRIKGLF